MLMTADLGTEVPHYVEEMESETELKVKKVRVKKVKAKKAAKLPHKTSVCKRHQYEEKPKNNMGKFEKF